MSQPIQFASQYTYDVMYQSSPTTGFSKVKSDSLRQSMLDRSYRSTESSGVSFAPVSYDGEPRLMVDDTRTFGQDGVPDATMFRNLMRYVEVNMAKIREAMFEDEGLQLQQKTAAEQEEMMSNPFKAVEYEAGRRGTVIAPPDKTDHLKLFFVKGDNSRPVLSHVEVETQSNRLLEMGQRAPEEQAELEDVSAERGGEASADEGNKVHLHNPIAALQAVFNLPTEQVTVSPFQGRSTEAVPAAPAAPVTE